MKREEKGDKFMDKKRKVNCWLIIFLVGMQVLIALGVVCIINIIKLSRQFSALSIKINTTINGESTTNIIAGAAEQNDCCAALICLSIILCVTVIAFVVVLIMSLRTCTACVKFECERENKNNELALIEKLNNRIIMYAKDEVYFSDSTENIEKHFEKYINSIDKIIK